jgi:hypothetical protein
MAVWADDITDLVNLTLEELGEDHLTDLATDLQDYTAASRLLPKAKSEAKTGTSLKFQAIFQGDGNFAWTSMFGVDNLDHVDGSHYGDVPWRGAKTGMTFDLDEEAINQGPRQIVNFIKTKRYQRDISYVDGIETAFWGGPSSSSDSLTLFGLLKYWLTYNATTGFNGGNHTNFSGGPAGIDASNSDYAQWKHYTGQYTSATDETDLIAIMRKAIRYTRFKGIPNKPVPEYKTGNKYEIYTTGDTLEGLEDVARNQNDRLGNNLAMYQDNVVIGPERVPITWVPYLQTNHATSDPVIGLNWGAIKLIPLKGRWMVETPFREAPNQHTVRQSFLDCRMNLCMNARRDQFLIAKSDPMSD